MPIPSIERIRTLRLDHPVRILNVCGGHERTLSLSGLRGPLAAQVELIPGPGCPVCVCPEEDIYYAVRLALSGVIVVSFGDMLRVPCNATMGEPTSLAAARTHGADVRAVASPTEAVRIADRDPERPVVFFAAGFETTMAPVAAMVRAGVPDNLSVLQSGRLTWPIVQHLLSSGDAGFDALIAPGHVATIMGAEQWRPVTNDYGLPCAVAGFSGEQLLLAIETILSDVIAHRAGFHNLYPTVVQPYGNALARTTLDDVFRVDGAPWRGIGPVPHSGYHWRENYQFLDARLRHPLPPDARRTAGRMPPACACAEVVLGRVRPNACPLYGKGCTPTTPIGPCMVSDEGACRIWWASGIRHGLKRDSRRDLVELGM